MTVRSGMDITPVRQTTESVRRVLISSVLLTLIVATTSIPLLAQNAPTANSRIVLSQDIATQNTASDERQAKDWGLQPNEWARFQELMQGPLGIYSPNLDPITALGIEAETDEDRRRFAELQVQAEARRVEKLLTYQRAYDAAWQRLYPDLPRIDLTGSTTLPQNGFQPTRLAVFVRNNCPSCEQRVRQMQAEGAVFDLYLVDSQQDDTLVRQWAVQVGIDPAKVRDRTITLNHDNGRWRASGAEGELPAVIRDMSGQWPRQ